MTNDMGIENESNNCRSTPCCANTPISSSRSKEDGRRCQTSERSHKQRQHREVQREKDRFLIFTRILVKLLEQTDMAMYHEVRDAIRDCTERKARNEPGFESATNVLRERIREIVNDETWHRTEMYLERYMKQEKSLQRSSSFRQSRKGNISSNVSTTSSQYSCPYDGSVSVISRFSVDTTATDDSCSLTSNSPFHSTWTSNNGFHPPASPCDTISSFKNNNHHRTNDTELRIGNDSCTSPRSCNRRSGKNYIDCPNSRRRPPSYPGSVVVPVSSAKVHRTNHRYEKDNFVVLMRVLLNLLKEKDPDGLLSQNVQDVVQDCIARNQRNEPGYEDVRSIVRKRLEVIVPSEYWEAAKQQLGDHDETEVHVR
jgi:hypothetical protein